MHVLLKLDIHLFVNVSSASTNPRDRDIGDTLEGSTVRTLQHAQELGFKDISSTDGLEEFILAQKVSRNDRVATTARIVSCESMVKNEKKSEILIQYNHTTQQ